MQSFIDTLVHSWRLKQYSSCRRQVYLLWAIFHFHSIMVVSVVMCNWCRCVQRCCFLYHILVYCYVVITALRIRYFRLRKNILKRKTVLNIALMPLNVLNTCLSSTRTPSKLKLFLLPCVFFYLIFFVLHIVSSSLYL